MKQYSSEEITAIESYYNICLPIKYKKMLLLMGDEILNFNEHCCATSIYEIQQEIIDSTEDNEDDPTYKLKNMFFITNTVFYNEYNVKDYFIEPKRQIDPSLYLDCPVYFWDYCESSGIHTIEKFSDSIEEWLLKMSFILYIEFQIKNFLQSKLAHSVI